MNCVIFITSFELIKIYVDIYNTMKMLGQTAVLKINLDITPQEIFHGTWAKSDNIRIIYTIYIRVILIIYSARCPQSRLRSNLEIIVNLEGRRSMTALTLHSYRENPLSSV